jgi:filamentous hemagglutinin
MARLVVPTLQNAALAVIDARKFTSYCLDPRGRQGRHKARVFKTALGYDLGNYGDLIASLRRGILNQEAEYQGETAHGERWRVDLTITGRSGRATVRTSWLYEKGNDVPRLTTAYVVGRP